MNGLKHTSYYSESLDENYKEIQGQPHQTRLGLVVKIQEIQGAAWINFTLIYLLQK